MLLNAFSDANCGLVTLMTDVPPGFLSYSLAPT
jgi:hypothetical protein